MTKPETTPCKIRHTELLPRNCTPLDSYSEGDFEALLWRHRFESVHGLTLTGDVENEPAFSDESNPLTQLFRSLKHIESLGLKRLVVDWRLRAVAATPQAVLLKSLRKLSQRCTLALVIHKESDHAAAAKLLSICHVKKSVPQAIAWLRAFQQPTGGPSRRPFPKWAPIVAEVVGILTFLFFVALSTASLFHVTLPAAGRFPAEVVLAIGGAVSSGLFGGHAAMNGTLLIPFAQNSTPVQISVVGGVAILMILLILGRILFG